MLNLIHAELFKLSKSISTKICILLSCLSAVALVYISHSIAVGDMSADISGSASGLTEIMIVSLLGSLLGGVLVCTDFETKTMHDQITCGKGRIAIVISKVIVYVLLIIALLLPYVIATMIGVATGEEFSKPFVASVFVGLLYDQTGNGITMAEIGKIVVISMITMLVHAARLSICIPFAFKVRKPVAVMTVGFAFSAIIDLLIGLIEDVPVLGDLVAYTPFHREFLILKLGSNAEILIKAGLFSFIFLVLMILLTYRIFKRAEIK